MNSRRDCNFQKQDQTAVDTSYTPSVMQDSGAPHLDETDLPSGTRIFGKENREPKNDMTMDEMLQLKESCSNFHNQDYIEKIKEFHSYVDTYPILPLLKEIRLAGEEIHKTWLFGRKFGCYVALNVLPCPHTVNNVFQTEYYSRFALTIPGTTPLHCNMDSSSITSLIVVNMVSALILPYWYYLW